MLCISITLVTNTVQMHKKVLYGDDSILLSYTLSQTICFGRRKQSRRNLRCISPLSATKVHYIARFLRSVISNKFDIGNTFSDECHLVVQNDFANISISITV